MILSLALRYQKQIALFLLSISFVQLTIAERVTFYRKGTLVNISSHNTYGSVQGIFAPSVGGGRGEAARKPLQHPVIALNRAAANHAFIGGPTQPESQSFSSVGANNMVDLFSGDFSYNVPLLDVGGYPVNIGYHSGITMDEEASWVGLGWNINPGTITRNMRGVPDDFNGGADTMRKVANIKPNDNWGATIGGNMEIFGLGDIKKIENKDTSRFKAGLGVGYSFGIFHNTYNGWGFEQSLNASLSVGGKSAGTLTGGLSLTNNTQNGITVLPSLSYQFKQEDHNKWPGWGAGLSVSAPYNSMTGLKGMQMGLNADVSKTIKDSKGKDHSESFGTSRSALLFAWAPYTPFITMPMTNSNNTVTAKIGGEVMGHHASAFISGYWGSEYIAPADTSVAMPVFGYLNYQNYVGNRDAVTDFNREKEITYREKPAVPHIGIPTYTYDVFSISGEGTGGTFRSYRGDIGYISDHRIRSKTKTDAFSGDVGFGNIVHAGVDLNFNYAYTQTGPWEAENAIGNTINFRNSHDLFEASYFRNPGEKAINTKTFYDKLGGDDVVAPALSQRDKNSPTIIAANILNRYSGKAKVGSLDVKRDSVVRTTRDKRAQVISYLTASEASVVGLDKYIYHHKINTFDNRHCDDISVGDTISLGVGLNGYFYTNTEFKGAPFVPIKLNETIHNDWERWTPYWCHAEDHRQISITEGFNNDNFTARWLGRLKAPETGTYDFGVNVDDRIRVWFNDSIVLDNWKPRAKSNWQQITLNLIKDHFYTLRVEYLELGGNGFAYVHMFWRTPSGDHTKDFNKGNNSGDKDTINAKFLYPPVFTDTAIVDNVITREDRVNNFRKSSHISEIDVLNPDGRRYVYGIPVYNLEQKEVSFSVDGDPKNNLSGMTKYTDQENSTRNNSGKQGYYSRQEIPAYAHSFLLTGILSPDYVDITGNGISDDDQGDAVRFNYSKTAGIASPFEWRAPYNDSANYAEGLKTYSRDDKANYISGKKELWYLHSIESKTMIATFTLQSREDLLAITEEGEKNNNGKALCLKEINLYSKADFLAKGTGATPIKTVHFDYTYELCRGINKYGHNGVPMGNDSGKLTLRKIWFTYNGNDKGRLNPYEFYYHNNNPHYITNATDKWGTYKDPMQNPGAVTGNPLTNADYPYALQDSALAAYNAAAWTMDSIKLPSGGGIKVKYESDDYGYVQNRRATQMMQLAGFGSSKNLSNDDRLYSVDPFFNATDNQFAFVRIPVRVTDDKELYARYLDGLKKLYFRVSVNMPTDQWGSGSEYISCYADPDLAYNNGKWYGITSDPNIMWIKVAGVSKAGDGSGGYSPLAQAAINFVRLNLPSKVDPDREPGDKFNVLTAVTNLIPLMPFVSAAMNGFDNARLNNLASHTTLARSYVRLNSPALKKLGGGIRVKSVLIYDSWDKMTRLKDKKQLEAVYGQNYDYTMVENVNGVPTRISSGVAAWEPAIGAEENPFHLPIEYQEKISVMAPAATMYSEEPLGEAFFPGASIGYRNVRVRSIHTNKTRSANGYTESRFYTTYDFPTRWDYSVFDNDTKKRYKPALRNFLRIDAKNYLTISQGFKVELNDMNGKLRSEATYSENDSVGLISYTENFYRVDNNNVTAKTLNNVVTTISPDGTIDTTAIIGKDVELMADMRDQTSVTIGANAEVNVDIFTVPGPTPAPPAVVPSLIPMYQKETTQFRSAAMTKVIYRYGIIDSVVHIEKGSKVSTKNMLYDAETGDPLLTRTQNEFNDPIYQFSYPSHWVYKGIGPAYQNIDALLMHLQVRNGKITFGLNGHEATDYLIGGDELLVYSKESYGATGCAVGDTASFADSYKLWVIDSNLVHGGAPQLYLVDKNGTPFSGNDVTLKVIRSGHRNINGSVGSVTSLRSPLRTSTDGNYHLIFDTATHVVTADASEMAQYWKVADKRKSDATKSCIATNDDSAKFAEEACNCMLPFFDHLIKTNQLFVHDFKDYKTVDSLAHEIPGFDINNCSLLKNNKDELFKPVSADPSKTVYECYIGNMMVELYRRMPSSASYYDYTVGSCTPNGVVFKKANVEIQQPDTVTVRIAPNFSASLLSTQTCPTFKDSLTLIDSASDRLITENNLNLGGYERNALAIMDFNKINDVPGSAEILSARLLLQADQRGHKQPMWPNANSVNPVDNLSVSLVAGWYSPIPLSGYHEEVYNSEWYREVKRTVPFQNDTIDVKEYVDGYRFGTYTSTSFMLTQGATGFHADTSKCTFGEFVEPPGYLQSGYGNYYSTWYSQKYADPAKWPVMEVKYVIHPPMPDTFGLEVRYNSTRHCTDATNVTCYSAITDTTVNPYQYGILGNFRPLRGYVYYGRRMEFDTSQSINTRTNGVIENFAPFWIMQNNQWVPSYDTTRWVWNSQTTLFNRKGFELENKDPLGRYNAGIYGYGLTLPTAVLQNSHYQEGAYEGFEDYGFETNTCDNACPVAKPFDFSAFKTGFTTAQAHTGRYSLKVDVNTGVGITADLQVASDEIVPQLTANMQSDDCGAKLKGLKASKSTIVPSFAPIAGKKVLIGGWVKEDNSCLCKGYTRNHIVVSFTVGGSINNITLNPSGNLVEGWQRYESVVDIPANATQMKVTLTASDSATTYFDDIRIHPFNAQMKSFVYNAVNLRLMAELDENNYATFYEYDDDGTLVRVKKETERGVQTIKESRSALSKEQ